jgi:hypothetical protein
MIIRCLVWDSTCAASMAWRPLIRVVVKSERGTGILPVQGVHRQDACATKFKPYQYPNPPDTCNWFFPSPKP